ncbi:DUF3800 domain-containing protein [Agromyces agglutinans]|uniref:DUF3800 domain-containing protein n=1 Tax=Agromyces agglutinans TaxID=2662258 RepID=UPI0028AECD73|nr:DUF3800 domain-containing protein [Agromyces agglutinans]
MPASSDYIVYVDESGDHNLVNLDPQYPVFVLAFCIFPIASYVDEVVPQALRLKFDFFGHDIVVLHEREIRKSAPPFDILLDASVRKPFLERLDRLITTSRFGIVACVIDKARFRNRRGLDISPYEVALEFGLERVFLQLQQRGQRGRKTHVVFESRGRTEDADLERQFARVMETTTMVGMPETLEFRCASKLTNSTGLQVADMVARPIGLHVLRPEQSNHAWDVLQQKIVRSRQGRIEGYGLKIYP